MGSNGLSGKTRCGISYSDIEKNLRDFEKVVSKPKYICRKCRRIAADKEYLCKAKKLKSLNKSGRRQLDAA